MRGYVELRRSAEINGGEQSTTETIAADIASITQSRSELRDCMAEGDRVGSITGYRQCGDLNNGMAHAHVGPVNKPSRDIRRVTPASNDITGSPRIEKNR
ncbi:hypothetical protein G3N57_10335 [Paraburkholderia sp. Se-20369]|nr:hypothetical protein [Paraburkholderia sp. Se-20369]